MCVSGCTNGSCRQRCLVFAKAALLFLDNQADEHQQQKQRRTHDSTHIERDTRLLKDVRRRNDGGDDARRYFGKRKTPYERKQYSDDDNESNVVHTVYLEIVFRSHAREQ